MALCAHLNVTPIFCARTAPRKNGDEYRRAKASAL
jgi:hypothetical protein